MRFLCAEAIERWLQRFDFSPFIKVKDHFHGRKSKTIDRFTGLGQLPILLYFGKRKKIPLSTSYLNNREAFVQYSTNGSNRLYIYFLDGSGNFTKGVIKEDADYNLSFYTEYPIKKEYIERNQYMLFKMRKSMPVYYSDGRRWGTVAANCYVATDRNLCGSSHPDWAYIKYVQSSSGDWVKAG